MHSNNFSHTNAYTFLEYEQANIRIYIRCKFIKQI